MGSKRVGPRGFPRDPKDPCTFERRVGRNQSAAQAAQDKKVDRGAVSVSRLWFMLKTTALHGLRGRLICRSLAATRQGKCTPRATFSQKRQPAVI